MTFKMGVVGLGVMGASLARNIESKGFPVVGYDLDKKKMQGFLDGPAKGKAIAGADKPEQLMEMLEQPRRVLIMVPAGKPVDSVIAHLRPHLDEGDILIDGGNSLFTDTDRRCDDLAATGFRFVGAGVSGGEEGALLGPAIMPGGPKEAWEALAPIFQAIAAKAEDDEPCVDYMGPRGAGHYVKMVHNGIEYGDMQLICQAYFMMKEALGLSNDELYEVFSEWNKGELDSYLIEITRDIFTVKDKDGDGWLVDKIMDKAGAKGTGKWMSQLALDHGVPSTLVTEAVYARCLSAMKDGRVRASKVLKGPSAKYSGDKKKFIEQIRQALYASKICSYAQGFVQMQSAAAEYNWPLNFGDCAMLWRGGCIIRAKFLDRIKEAFDKHPNLENLLLHRYFADATKKA